MGRNKAKVGDLVRVRWCDKPVTHYKGVVIGKRAAKYEVLFFDDFRVVEFSASRVSRDVAGQYINTKDGELLVSFAREFSTRNDEINALLRIYTKHQMYSFMELSGVPSI